MSISPRQPSKSAPPRSFGIRGLHERASTVGGWVDLSSTARGTTLILSVPLAGEMAEDDAGAGAALEAAGLHDEHDPSNWGDL